MKEIEHESDDPDAMEAKKTDTSGLRDALNANDMCYEDQVRKTESWPDVQ